MQRLVFPLLLLSLLGTSARAQVVAYVDSVEVHRTDTIYFAFGSDALDEVAREAVAQLVADRPGELELYLEGHTDAVGSDRANDDLARRRSENTLAEALTAGWPETAVEIRHFGEQRLEVTTKGRERRNRRVLLRSGLPRRYARFRGRITNEEGEPLPGTTIGLGKYLKDTVRADANGYYEIDLPLGEPLQLNVFAEDHFFESKIMTVREGEQPDSLVTKLAAAKPGAILTVPDLFFIGNKAELLAESYPTLPKLLQFMRSNPNLIVEIAGHVNRSGPPKGPGTFQYALAQNRANYIFTYLKHFGIEPERMQAKGYSNFEMVFPEPRGEKQASRNRRVELRVVGKMRREQ
ncbi:MAG: OmpA family protein [Bacteroidota bacterium]